MIMPAWGCFSPHPRPHPSSCTPNQGKNKEIWSLTTKDWRWINGELYRITDTKETQTLATKYPNIVSKLKQDITTIQKKIGRKESEFKSISLQKDNVDLLKKLGYIE